MDVDDVLGLGLADELSQIPGSGIGNGHDEELDGLAVAVAVEVEVDVALGEALEDAASQIPGIGTGNGHDEEDVGDALALAVAIGRATCAPPDAAARGAAWAAIMPTPAIPVALTRIAIVAMPAR
ncbi:MAG: hypothetical protein ACTHK4_04250 [Mycobacteriales bacterium]